MIDIKFKETVRRGLENIEKLQEEGKITVSSTANPDATVYKVGLTFWVCKAVADKLNESGFNRSRLADWLFCQYFGISYEEAYGRKAIRQRNDKRLWDFEWKRRSEVIMGEKKSRD